MLRISISFPSGSGKTLELDELSKVKDLKLLAHRSFGRGFLKFVPAKGHVLTNPADSLQAAGIQDGEHLTAVAQDGKLIAANKAFALWCCGGNSVVTWGNPHSGGSCSAILAGQSKTRLDSSFVLLLPARYHSGHGQLLTAAQRSLEQFESIQIHSKFKSSFQAISNPISSAFHKRHNPALFSCCNSWKVACEEHRHKQAQKTQQTFTNHLFPENKTDPWEWVPEVVCTPHCDDS